MFAGKIEHVHTVCTRPFLSEEGPGDEAKHLRFVQIKTQAHYIIMDFLQGDQCGAHSCSPQ